MPAEMDGRSQRLTDSDGLQRQIDNKETEVHKREWEGIKSVLVVTLSI